MRLARAPAGISHAMSDTGQARSGPDIESLFVLGEGRLSRGLARARLTRGARLRAGRVAWLSVGLTWLPLLLLAALDGVAWGMRVEVPFLKDFLPYGQFLLAAPVLILGELLVGRQLGLAAAELRRSDVLAPEDTAAYDGLLSRAVERWRGRGVNTVLVVVTLAVTGLTFLRAQEWLTGSWQYVGDRMTLAGWWYLLISAPLLRFLSLRWIWRLLLWTWVLWRTAQFRLQLLPTHPDRAGGLSFLGATQAAFGVLSFAFGAQISCLIADAVVFRGESLMSFKGHLIAFVLGAVVVLLVPLLVFAPKLVRAREESLLFLSGCGYHGAQHLDRQLHSSRSEGLPSEAISGLSDFGVLYENARGMKPVPLGWRHIIALALAAVLPFGPLIFLVMPAQEVFKTLAKLLL